MNFCHSSRAPMVKQATNVNELNKLSIPVHVSLHNAITSIEQCESTHISCTLDCNSAKLNSETTVTNEYTLQNTNFYSNIAESRRIDEKFLQIDKDLNTDSGFNTICLDQGKKLVSNKNNMKLFNINNNDIFDTKTNKTNANLDNYEIDQGFNSKTNLKTSCGDQDNKIVFNKNSSKNHTAKAAVEEIYQIEDTDFSLNSSCLDQGSKLISALNSVVNNNNDQTNKINTTVLSVKNNNAGLNTELQNLNSALCSECSKQEAPSNLSSDELCEKHFQCNFCNKRFSNKQNCDRHYRTHTNDKPYECNVCGRRFPFQRSRDRHYRTHTNEKAYECNICAKRFSRNQGLKSHILTHTKEKPHQCEICCKRFPRIGSLRQHYRLHTNERPYDCEACEKSFSLKRNRDKHFRVVHMHEKPFQCNECSKKFSSQKTLQCHATTHTNEKPFLCDVCNKRYSHKASLTLHCKQHLS